MNNNQINFRRFLVLFLSVLFLTSNFSCKKDFSKISTSDWKPGVAAPFIQTTIVLSNLFKDDSNLVTQPDSTLVYFYAQDSVFSISADTILDLEKEITEEQMFSLGELYMPSFGFETDFTMNDLLPYLEQDVQDSLLKYDGSVNYFPPFQLLEAVTIEAEAVEDFVELSFSDGKIFIEIKNNLPVVIENIEFDVLDLGNNYIIKHISIDALDADGQHLDSTDIAGLTLSNQFGFLLYSVESQGSFPEMVNIDLSKGMLFGMQANNLKIVGGRAKIVEQIMYAKTEMIDFNLSPEQLHHILFSDGIFSYQLQSQLNVGVNVTLQLPTAEIDNEIPSQQFILEAGGNVNQQWDIAGMSTDLTTDPEQVYNRMPISIEILILPTDYIVEFDSADKVSGVFSMEDLNLQFADGYLGKQEITISQDTFDLNFDFMERLEGELILEDPSMTIDYTNGLGVPFRIATEFLGINTTTGEVHYLDYDSVDIAIPPEPGVQIEDEIIIDNSNSSIVDFLAIRPNQIIYYGGGLTNPEGYGLNFIDDQAKLVGNVELKIPLILRADHLSFSDTLGFSGTSEEFPVQEGLIQLNVLNGFPFDLTLSMLLTDSITGEVLDEIVFNNIASAIVDENGKVTENSYTEVVVEFDENFMENMKISNRAFLKVVSSTFGNGEVPVVLYSDYKMEIAIGFLAKISP